MGFYDRLQACCKESNTTVTALLQTIGLSTSKGTAWKGGSVPRSDVLYKLAEVLQTTPAYLMGETDDPSPLPSGAWEADMGNVAPLLGTVRAGLPMYAEENIEDYIPIRQADGALLASGDDTKTITFEDGELSYSASALGTTTTVRLEKQQ